MLDINVGLKPSILRPFEELRSSLGSLRPSRRNSQKSCSAKLKVAEGWRISLKLQGIEKPSTSTKVPASNLRRTSARERRENPRPDSTISSTAIVLPSSI